MWYQGLIQEWLCDARYFEVAQLEDRFFLVFFHIQVLIETFADIAPTILDNIYINLIDFDKSVSPDCSNAIDGDKREVIHADSLSSWTGFNEQKRLYGAASLFRPNSPTNL